MNKYTIKPKGIYRDQITNSQGKSFDSGWCSNVIVTRCRDLLAAFMKGDSATGIQFIAIGKGDSNWDTTTLGTPQTSTSSLVDSVPFILDISDSLFNISYLDSNNSPTTVATNRVQVSVNLPPGTPPIEAGQDDYPLREFGLFGLLDTTEYMIDYVRHPVIHKGPEDNLVRTIRLVF